MKNHLLQIDFVFVEQIVQLKLSDKKFMVDHSNDNYSTRGYNPTSNIDEANLEVVAAIKPGGINKEALRNTTLLCLGKASGRRGPGGVVLEN